MNCKGSQNLSKLRAVIMLDKLKVNREVKNIWDKVYVKRENECWEWLGDKDKHGYGRITYEGKRQLVTRVLWKLMNDLIPDGMCICHTCDNPSCLNPKHLFLGSHHDNMVDMKKKGRGRGKIMYGVDNPKTKLTEVQIREIRKRRNNGERGIDLAKEFGVTPTLICSIFKGRR